VPPLALVSHSISRLEKNPIILKTIIIISANAEWRAIRELLSVREVTSTSVGEWFDRDEVKYFHGGWGKISAAATAQFVIDHFQPDLLVNLGTCGGIAGFIEPGEVILVDRTIVYDIFEQMGDGQEAIEHYMTELDLSWLRQPYPHPVRRGLLVSADRDILVEDIPQLKDKYGAVAADWESGAIAWVAKKNQVRCLILRGVTDVVGSGGGEAYGNIALFHERTKDVMKALIEQLPDWLRNIES
jgi:adenosylhomocysteine nucleosidase